MLKKENNEENQTPVEKVDKKEKKKKAALSLTEKNRKKIHLWYISIYMFLGAMLAFSTFFAVYKHQKAMTSLNKANQIMMTNTGIVIDSVNIKSFQEAELMLSEKQKTVDVPENLRNIFLFNTRVHVSNSETLTKPEENVTTTTSNNPLNTNTSTSTET